MTEPIEEKTSKAISDLQKSLDTVISTSPGRFVKGAAKELDQELKRLGLSLFHIVDRLEEILQRAADGGEFPFQKSDSDSFRLHIGVSFDNGERAVRLHPNDEYDAELFNHS